MASPQIWIGAVPQVLVGLLLAGRWLLIRPAWSGVALCLREAARKSPLAAIGKGLAALAVLSAVGWWLLQPVPAAGMTDGAHAGPDWPTFAGSPLRNGAAAGLVQRRASGALCWRFCDALVLERRPFASSPALAGRRVLIGSDNFKLYCLDIESGRQLWAFEARWPIFSSPAVWNGRVYVGEGLHEQNDSKLYCLSLADGRILWEKQTQSHTESTPTVSDGKVYFGAGDDGIYCCDALTGQVLWQFSEPHVDGGPLVVEGKVYFGSGYGFEGVYCLDADNGGLIWKRRMPAPVWGAPSFADGRLYVAVGNGNFLESAAKPYGEVRCLNPADGTDIWRFTEPEDAVIGSVAVSGRTAVFGSRDGCVYGVDSSTGGPLWRSSANSPVLATCAICDNQVLFGADDGRLRCLDLRDGALLWSYDTAGDVLPTEMDARIHSSPAVSDGRVVFGSANGSVYCLGAAAGTSPAASAQHGSRLMWAVDFALSGAAAVLASTTGSAGWAILITATLLMIGLLPADLLGARQAAKLRQAQPEVVRIRRTAPDDDTGRREVCKLYLERGIRPLRPLMIALLQAIAFILSILVVQSTPLFDGRSFLWIANLAALDGVVLVARVPVLGMPLSLLGLIFIVSAWGFLLTLLSSQTRREPTRAIGFLLLASGLGRLTSQWSSASLLFAAALLLLSALRNAFCSSSAAQGIGPPGAGE